MTPFHYAPKRILVALDGSPVAEEALPQALASAHAFNAELLLLQVVAPVLSSLPVVSAIMQEPTEEEPEGEDVRAARAYLEALAENLREQRACVICKVRRGLTVDTVLEEASHADLLVLANRGAGLLPRLMGSVALQVVPRSPCPVLVVPTMVSVRDPEAPIRNFAEVAERYGPLVQRPLGLRTVPIERIVGSVGRANELRPDFMPRHQPRRNARLKNVQGGMDSGAEMPPIDLYKLGYDYYVLDGHHRVAAARANGQLEIDAVVTEFLPLDSTDLQGVFLERRAFEQATGLTRIGATRPGHYGRLQEMIAAYAQEKGIANLKDAALLWYTEVYGPMTAQIRATRLANSFPGERTADLVVHVEDARAAEERRLGRPVRWEDALHMIVTRYRSSRRHTRLRMPNLRQLLLHA